MMTAKPACMLSPVQTQNERSNPTTGFKVRAVAGVLKVMVVGEGAIAVALGEDVAKAVVESAVNTTGLTAVRWAEIGDHNNN